MEKVAYPAEPAAAVDSTIERFEARTAERRKEEEVTDAMIEAALPKPCGFKLLLALPDVEDKYNGLLLKARETMHVEQLTTVVALVLDVGPEAYGDQSRFPSGPWCKQGDYVLIGPYKGQRFSVYGREYRIINDDMVEGVVPDPKGYRRI
jgi:co-chaperonin GroES (HSP10)